MPVFFLHFLDFFPPVFQCTQVPGKLKQIDAGAGEVYGVNDAQNIFHLVNNTWQQVPGSLIHVTVGPAGVWGVNKAHNVFKFQGNNWMTVTGKYGLYFILKMFKVS